MEWLKYFVVSLLLLFIGSARASQTYVPPPPPKLPAQLSAELVSKGKKLFEENTFIDGPIEIHNYLGKKGCYVCHDQTAHLNSEHLANQFKDLRQLINKEIVKNSNGIELPATSPAMDALVQYMVQRYKLYEFKLPK